MTSEKTPKGLRTVKFWVRYDPERRMLRDSARYKWQLAEPSRESGEILLQVKGHYVAAPGKSEQQP